MPDSEKKLKRVVIKEELIALTGDWLQAVILNQFLYWGQRVKDFDAFILEERLRKNEPGLELTHGWIWKSASDLKDEVMVEPLSEDTVRRRVSALVESGWLEERNNPHHKWDRTLQYRPNIRKIQYDLQALGYALEGYPLLTEDSYIPQAAESKPQSAESSPNGAESNPQGAGALPEITTETKTETPGDGNGDLFLPEAKDQIPILFGGRTSGKDLEDAEMALLRSGWSIRGKDIKDACVCLLSVTDWDVPPDDDTRKAWYAGLRCHTQKFPKIRLLDLYAAAYDRLLSNPDLTLPPRPQTLTKTMESIWEEGKRGNSQFVVEDGKRYKVVK